MKKLKIVIEATPRISHIRVFSGKTEIGHQEWHRKGKSGGLSSNSLDWEVQLQDYPELLEGVADILDSSFLHNAMMEALDD